MSSWTQIGDDIIGENSYDRLGWSISLSSDGTIVAIGAPLNDDNGNDSGHVRVYEWDGSSWNKVGIDINGEASNDNSGYSVSLSSDGTILAIGAYNNDGNGSNSGHVRVYEWDGSEWNKLGQDINGEASNDRSGWSVSLSSDGTILAVGARLNDGINGSNSGHVRVYEFNGSEWNQLGSDLDGKFPDDEFGRSVSLSSDGTIVAIGAPLNDDNGTDSGHVRVYEWDGSSWNQLGSDIIGEGSGDNLGFSISLSSDGTILAIGAIYNDGINASNSGHTRVYKLNESTWEQIGNDIDGIANGDQTGISVSLSSDGTILAVGAIYNDSITNNSGEVKVYQWNGSSWTQLGQDIEGQNNTEILGRSVSLSSDGTIVAIGSPYLNINNTGYASVYELILDSGICVTGDTLIETNQGFIEIENINPKTTTINNKEIKAISKIIYKKKNLVKIEKEAFGYNKPIKDTYLTQDHKILFDGKMITANRLYHKNIEGISLVKYEKQLMYNILMDKHTIMKGNNIIMETLDPENIISKYFLKKDLSILNNENNENNEK